MVVPFSAPRDHQGRTQHTIDRPRQLTMPVMVMSPNKAPSGTQNIPDSCLAGWLETQGLPAGPFQMKGPGKATLYVPADFHYWPKLKIVRFQNSTVHMQGSPTLANDATESLRTYFRDFNSDADIRRQAEAAPAIQITEHIPKAHTQQSWAFPRTSVWIAPPPVPPIRLFLRMQGMGTVPINDVPADVSLLQLISIASDATGISRDYLILYRDYNELTPSSLALRPLADSKTLTLWWDSTVFSALG